MTNSNKIEEPTNNELRLKLAGLGMPMEDAKRINSKSALQITLKAMQVANKADKDAKKIKELEEEIKEKKVKTLQEKETPKEKKQVDTEYLTKIDIMRNKLNEQKRVRIKLALEGKETIGIVKRVVELSDEELKSMNLIKTKRNELDTVGISGSIETVTLNGYRTHIPKGVYVEVSNQVAGVLDEADRNTSEAGKNILFDRFDPETGKTVRESMT